MRRLSVMIGNELMILVRDSTTLFWILIFPFFFLFMMLFSYGTEGNLPQQTIEIADQDHSDFSERYAKLIGDTFSEKESIPAVLKSVNADARVGPKAVRVTVPEGFGYAVERQRPIDVKITYAEDGMPAQFAVKVIRALTVRFNADVAKAPELVDLHVDDRDAVPAMSFTQYTLTGILVMSMMSAGMTTICIALAYRRERNGFKMMACMPIPPSAFMLSMLASRMLVLCAAAFALLFGARYLFGIPLVLSAPRLLQVGVVVVLGGTMLLAMGTAMGARMATVSSATLVTNLVYIALLFLSDLTMPLTAMPAAVSAVMKHLPTAEFVTALRHVLVRGEGLPQQGALLAAMAGWTLLFGLIGRLSFRWHRQAGG